MTIHAWKLLRKLKKAQICLDGQIGIDADEMKAVTIHDCRQKHKVVSLKGYAGSLESTLDFLKEQGCICFDDLHCFQVTYTGWYLFSATLFDVLRGIVVNILIPAVVSIIAAIITTMLMP